VEIRLARVPLSARRNGSDRLHRRQAWPAQTSSTYPAVSGLWGKPTLINNVETFANIAPIIRKGGAWFAGMGSERSKGTRSSLFTGKIRNTGLVEVPWHQTARHHEGIGGGVPDGRTFKAVQTGGPSGGCSRLNCSTSASATTPSSKSAP